jgi:hypothetical protein
VIVDPYCTGFRSSPDVTSSGNAWLHLITCYVGALPTSLKHTHRFASSRPQARVESLAQFVDYSWSALLASYAVSRRRCCCACGLLLQLVWLCLLLSFHEVIFKAHSTCTHTSPSTNQPSLSLAPPCAAVVVLSEEFLSSTFPAAELHLLLERRSIPGSKGVIVPVFYGVTCEQVVAKRKAATAATQALGAAAAAADGALHANLSCLALLDTDELTTTDAPNVAGVSCITGIRPDQVRRPRLICMRVVIVLARSCAARCCQR